MEQPHRQLSILSFKLITQILDPQSSFAEYERAHQDYVQKYTLLVPYPSDTKVSLAKNIIAYGVAGRNKIIQLVKMFLKARALVTQNHYDVITVADSYYVALLGLIIARRYKLGFEVQVHGFEKFFGVRAYVARQVLPEADVIRVPSKRLKKFIMDEFGIAEQKIIIAPVFVPQAPTLWITPQKGRTFLGSYPQPQGELATQIASQKKNDFIFLTISRLVPVKNIYLQMMALKNMLPEYPATQLWIVGDGPEQAHLETQAKDLGISDHVIFWGRQAEVATFYKNADSYLLSSDSEGWGLVIVEAATYGLPILMTDVGCAGEFIYDGKNGLVVPVGDVKAFEEGMRKLRRDAVFRESLGREAKASLTTLPTKEELIERYVSAWEKALAASRKKSLF